MKTKTYSRDRSVGTATGYGLDGRGSIPSMGKIFGGVTYFSLLHRVQTGNGLMYPMVLGVLPRGKKAGA
jgi:hypothetical protein